MHIRIGVLVEQFVMHRQRIANFHFHVGAAANRHVFARSIAKRNVESIDAHEGTRDRLSAALRHRHFNLLRSTARERRKQQALLQVDGNRNSRRDTRKVARWRMTGITLPCSVEVSASCFCISGDDVQRPTRVPVARNRFHALVQKMGEIDNLGIREVPDGPDGQVPCERRGRYRSLTGPAER